MDRPEGTNPGTEEEALTDDEQRPRSSSPEVEEVVGRQFGEDADPDPDGSQ